MTDKQISDRESAIMYLSILGESITEGNIAEIIRTRHKVSVYSPKKKGNNYY